MKLTTRLAALGALFTASSALAANGTRVAEFCCALGACCGLGCC